jgi:hypothetical protein
MLYLLIFMFRFPISIVAISVVCLTYSILLILETSFLFVYFPLLVILNDKKSIKNSWVFNYPNSLRKFFSFSPQKSIIKIKRYGVEKKEIVELAGGLLMIKIIWIWAYKH